MELSDGVFTCAARNFLCCRTGRQDKFDLAARFRDPYCRIVRRHAGRQLRGGKGTRIVGNRKESVSPSPPSLSSPERSIGRTRGADVEAFPGFCLESMAPERPVLFDPICRSPIWLLLLVTRTEPYIGVDFVVTCRSPRTLLAARAKNGIIRYGMSCQLKNLRTACPHS